MALSVNTGSKRVSDGSKTKILGAIAFDASYPTGGESLSKALIGLNRIDDFQIRSQEGGYLFNAEVDAGGNTVTIKVFTGGVSAHTPAGTNSTSAVTGTGTFVGTSAGALELATPAFSGTGFATAGQVVTTTDNQTMTLNQCAGMWLIANALTTTAPALIVSNTAVTGAPAVLTVIGTAPATDAGTYKIVKNIIPTGSVTALSGTAAAQTFTGTAILGAAATEVANATDLSALTSVEFTAIGA